MPYLACDKDGTEIIFAVKPNRGNDEWEAPLYRVYPVWVMQPTANVKLPKGSITKLIGIELTWSDEPVMIE